MNFTTDPESENAGSAGPGGAGGDATLDALNETDASFVTDQPGKKGPPSRGTLMLAGLGVLLAGVIYFMYFRGGPSAASAAELAPAAGPDTTVKTFLADGEGHVKLMQQMLQNTDKVVQRFRTYPAQTQVPLTGLRTNPFRALVPKAKPENESEAAAKRRREEERDAAAVAVAKLKLQSVLQGRSTQACMINGKMYQRGQEIDTFTVEQINTGSVIVRTGSFRFELTMEK